MRLDELLADVEAAVIEGDPSTEIGGVAYHSGRVQPGDLFCCLPGAHADGHDHAGAALDAGAAALLVERSLPVPAPQVLVDPSAGGARAAMALCAAAFHGHPSRAMTVVGITGTNGKTTTAHLLGAALAGLGEGGADQVRVLGTLSGVRTTPEAPDLQAQLAAWRSEGVRAVAMEVSSHALEMHRVDGVSFAAAVFTNLSRDHLDFHGTVEAYFAAKARLFSPELSSQAVVNLDSPYGRLLRDASSIPTVGYSLAQASDLELGVGVSRFVWRDQQVELHLGGRFNVSNALAAAETAVALGVPASTVAAALGQAPGVPGRFEYVEVGQPFSVVVDYAHTPDGLEQVLSASRELVGGASAGRSGEVPEGRSGKVPEGRSGKVIVVFGCGGDRDPAKRPMMGEVAARFADQVILTADNSRDESTRAIIEAVQEGFQRVPAQGDAPRAAGLAVEPDRRRAIAMALAAADPGDVVVVAGKGHETTLTIGDVVTDFDDRVVAREELERLAAATGGAGA